MRRLLIVLGAALALVAVTLQAKAQVTVCVGGWCGGGGGWGGWYGWSPYRYRYYRPYTGYTYGSPYGSYYGYGYARPYWRGYGWARGWRRLGCNCRGMLRWRGHQTVCQ